MTSGAYRYNRTMAIKVIDRFWHRTLKRPYLLKRAIDEGQGDPVVMLHGIGKTGDTWQRVVEQLKDKYRIVAFDLLGFGESPKPDWVNYSTDDHVQALVASIEKLKLNQPVILVGHSMGCLVAVRMAKERPDLVKHLVLYEMPLLEGLPNKRLYRIQTNLYRRFYQRVTKFQPSSSKENKDLTQRLAKRIVGFEVSEDSWQPFMKSVKHTIIDQTAAEDIKQISMPMDVIYGKLDMMVIRGRAEKFFGEDNVNIKAYTIRERHVISAKASQFIVDRIEAANEIDKLYSTSET